MSDRRRASPQARIRKQQSISICGRVFLADASGALFWPGQSMLIVADLSAGTSDAGGGPGGRRALDVTPPSFDTTRDCFVALAETIDRYGAETIVVLDGGIGKKPPADRLHQGDLEVLKIMQETCHWFWVTGSADLSSTAAAPHPWGGRSSQDLTVAGITLRHQPRGGSKQTHEIAGSLYPAARLSTYGHIVRRPCFVGNGRRLLLPAFGATAGGLNILDDAFAPLFGMDGMNAWTLGGAHPNPVASRKLCLG